MSTDDPSQSDSQYPPLYSCDFCNIAFANTYAYHGHLRDEHSSLFATSNHDFVEQVMDSRTARIHLQTAPAGEIYTIGPNLAKFRDFQLALPQPAVSDQLTSSTIAAYLNSPQQRELEVTVSEEQEDGESEDQDDEEAGTWITVRSVVQLEEGTDDSQVDRYDLAFPITSFDLNNDQQALLCSCLKNLLERVPKAILQLPAKIQNWLLTVALMQAKTQDPTIGLSLNAPQFRTSNVVQKKNMRALYSVPLTGFDAALQRTWKLSYPLPFSFVPAGPASNEDYSGFEWKWDANLEPSVPGLTTDDMSRWLSAARKVAVECFGWIGTREELKQYIGHILQKKPRIVQKKNPGDPLHPGRMVAYRMNSNGVVYPGRYMYATSADRKKAKLAFGPFAEINDAFGAVQAAFQALQSGHDTDTAWALGCHEADQIIEQLAEGLPRAAIISCQGTTCMEKIHLCPSCWKVRLCGDFVELTDFEYKICKHCKFVHQTQVGGDQLEHLSLIERVLLGALRIALGKEYKAAKIEASQTVPDIDEEAWNILRTLKPLIVSEHQCHDNIIEQVLDVGVVAKLTWFGHRKDPNTPSIDAYLRFVAGIDGKTRCHQAGNVHTVADWLNRMMRHHPKYLVIALSEMQNQRDPTLFLSGLAKMRDALIYSYEMGSLGD